MAVKVEITVKNMELSDRIKEYITQKASKLDRYLNEIDHVKIDLTNMKSARDANDRNIAQITARGRRILLRTEERADDLFAAFDSAWDKMQRQAERFKGKRARGRGDGRSAAEVLPLPKEILEEEGVIARRKTFDLIPMNESEALEQMKLLGHENFFIFFNVETNTINVVYQRRDGSYGLIEPKIH
jgi:putative sigma-54 modulation protein